MHRATCNTLISYGFGWLETNPLRGLLAIRKTCTKWNGLDVMRPMLPLKNSTIAVDDTSRMSERRLSGILLTLVALVLMDCGDTRNPPPTVTGIEPEFISTRVGSTAVLTGENLFHTLGTFDVDTNTPPKADDVFVVEVDGQALAPSQVHWLSPETIAIDFLAGQELGEHSINVIIPDGRAGELSQAFTVVDCVSDACGDGVCCQFAGEDACGCPEDCGPGTCGDGCCQVDEDVTTCASDCPNVCGDGLCTGSETSESCLEDCPDLCGDGTCAGSETPASCSDDCPDVCGDSLCTGSETRDTCPADCSTCAACTTSGPCSDSCATSCTLPTCTDSCACALDCSEATGSCTTQANDTSVATIDCTNAVDCNTECRADSYCSISCVNAQSCQIECNMNSSCGVDCTGGTCDGLDCRNTAQCKLDCTSASCDGLLCLNSAECLVNCTGASACNFAMCGGAETSCPGNIIVCNRPCP